MQNKHLRSVFLLNLPASRFYSRSSNPFKDVKIRNTGLYLTNNTAPTYVSSLMPFKLGGGLNRFNLLKQFKLS